MILFYIYMYSGRFKFLGPELEFKLEFKKAFRIVMFENLKIELDQILEKFTIYQNLKEQKIIRNQKKLLHLFKRPTSE